MQAYQAIAQCIDAAANCRDADNSDWFARHCDRIEAIICDHFPSGSGFDARTQFDIDAHIYGKRERLQFDTAFHHMDEAGGYDGWTHHSVIVTPSLAMGFNIRITGRDRNGIKDYIAEVFHSALSAAVV